MLKSLFDTRAGAPAEVAPAAASSGLSPDAAALLEHLRDRPNAARRRRVYCTLAVVQRDGFAMSNSAYKAALVELVEAGELFPCSSAGEYAFRPVGAYRPLVDWARDEPSFWPDKLKRPRGRGRPLKAR